MPHPSAAPRTHHGRPHDRSRVPDVADLARWVKLSEGCRRETNRRSRAGGSLLRGVNLDTDSTSGMVEVELPFEDRAVVLEDDKGHRIDSSSDQIADPDEEAKEGTL